MKIIVNNDSELALMEKFLLGVHELGLIDTMETEDNEEENLEDRFLNSDDYRILSETITDIKIVIDKTERELEYEDTDFVQGKCIHCGTMTRGLVDGHDPLSYNDYLEMISPDSQSSWRCEEC